MGRPLREPYGSGRLPAVFCYVEFEFELAFKTRRAKMNFQHVENLLIRFRGQDVNIKTMSGGVYEGKITDVTNDYVTLKVKAGDNETDQVIVMLHSIESILPQDST